MVVPLLDTRWVPSQAFTEIAAATRAGKMALDPSRSQHPLPAPPIAAAGRHPAIAAASPSAATNSKRAEGKRKRLGELRGVPANIHGPPVLKRVARA